MVILEIHQWCFKIEVVVRCVYQGVENSDASIQVFAFHADIVVYQT
jgi:hypothetical protein